MPRYINPKKIDFRIPYYPDEEGGDALVSLRAVKRCIDATPSEDVVPKSEVEELISENSSLAKTVNEASDLIRKLRSKLKKSKSDVAWEIFEEIEKILIRPESSTALFYLCSKHSYNELKKKYTEDK